MAGFRQHVAVSTALGVGYGAAAYFGFGIDWATCAVAAGLTGFAGMLPDLDSPTGQPVREVLGLTAALVPVLLGDQLRAGVACVYQSLFGEPADLTPQAIAVIIVASYFAVRFGGAWLLDRLTVHRGMFHSIPAALITAVVAFLLLQGPSPIVRLFLSVGPLLGFLSHLIMDEIWSVKLTGGDVGLKKSSGTAFKLFSSSIPATAMTYTVLLALSYLLLYDPGVNQLIKRSRVDVHMPSVAEELLDRVTR